MPGITAVMLMVETPLPVAGRDELLRSVPAVAHRQDRATNASAATIVDWRGGDVCSMHFASASLITSAPGKTGPSGVLEQNTLCYRAAAASRDPPFAEMLHCVRQAAGGNAAAP